MLNPDTVNLTSPGQGPQKQEDGSYAFVTAYREDTLLPVIDIQHDYGIFVRAAIEHCKPGDELLAHSEELTVCDMIKQLAEGAFVAMRLMCTEQMPTHRDRQKDRGQAHYR